MNSEHIKYFMLQNSSCWTCIKISITQNKRKEGYLELASSPLQPAI